MTDFVLVGPETGTKLCTLDGLMQEFGPDDGIKFARLAESGTVLIASSDPLRLVRRAQPGDDNRSFTDFLALVPQDAVPPPVPGAVTPRPPSEIAADEEDNAFEADGPRLALEDILSGKEKPQTVGQAVAAMVASHESGKQAFFHVETKVTITVPYKVTVVAQSQKHAEDVLRNLRESGDIENRIDFDPARIVSQAITALNYSRSLDAAGWVIDAEKVEKLSTEEVTALARKLIREKLEEMEEETDNTTKALHQFMRDMRKR